MWTPHGPRSEYHVPHYFPSEKPRVSGAGQRDFYLCFTHFDSGWPHLRTRLPSTTARKSPSSLGLWTKK